jgi:hypothetical protein
MELQVHAKVAKVSFQISALLIWHGREFAFADCSLL